MSEIQKIKDKLIAQHGKAKGMAIFRAVNRDASNQIAGGGGEIEGSELSKLMDSEDQITIYESKSKRTQGKALEGNTGMLAAKKNLKPIPAGNKGKGLSKLDKSVRNNMGFMYGGGMPMPSKKPRMSTTDYRKAANGMLILSIDMKKKKPKIKKNKRG